MRRTVTLGLTLVMTVAIGVAIAAEKIAAAVAVLHISAPSWTAQASGVTASLRGASAVSETVAWVSGSGGTVLRTADGGRTWRRLTVTSEALDFRDIEAADERTAYAMSIGTGPASRVYKTTDGGATWDRDSTRSASRPAAASAGRRGATAGWPAGSRRPLA